MCRGGLPAAGRLYAALRCRSVHLQVDAKVSTNLLDQNSCLYCRHETQECPRVQASARGISHHFFGEKRSSGPTPLRQIRTHHRKHKQSKNRQTKKHYHHGATLQTPIHPATHGPLSTSSFSTTYPVTTLSFVSTTRHTCHPTPTLCTPVLELSSHYPPALQLRKLHYPSPPDSFASL